MNSVFGFSCFYHKHHQMKANAIETSGDFILLAEHWTEHNRYYNGQQHWSAEVNSYISYTSSWSSHEGSDFDMHYFPIYVAHDPNSTISAANGRGAMVSMTDGHVEFMTQSDNVFRSPAVWRPDAVNEGCGSLPSAY